TWSVRPGSVISETRGGGRYDRCTRQAPIAQVGRPIGSVPRLAPLALDRDHPCAQWRWQLTTLVAARADGNGHAADVDLADPKAPARPPPRLVADDEGAR